jgi:type IV pilus assembly protein PilC
MPDYLYEAITEQGMTVKGKISADSADIANQILHSKGFIPLKIVTDRAVTKANLGANLRKGFERKIKVHELILFTKQFRSMLHAGVPILRMLQVLESQTQNHKLKLVINLIGQDVKEGFTVFDAMEKHPSVFPPLYRSMIRAGELSGNLPDVLERLIYILEHDAKIKADIKSALQYPIIVLSALGIAFFILLTFVVPRFASVFARVGINLPFPTLVAMTLYNVLFHFWYILLGILILTILGLRAYLKTSVGKYTKDTLLLRLPLIGPLFQKAVMSRFASIFAILQSSGIPVINAMNILSETIGNAAISREFEKVKTLVNEGQGISIPLRSANYFTPMVVDMIAIGEESGSLEEMLREVAVHYDDEVSYAVKRLSDAIGPVLVVGLAAVIGFFALAIFLPMWDLTKAVH